MDLLKKIICTSLVTILFIASVNTPVFAAEQSEIAELEANVESFDSLSGSGVQQRSTTFIDTAINISFSEDGMYVSIHTGMSMTGSVVGVKDIEIQKKGLLGTWTTVAVSSGGEVTNTSGCSVSLTYTGAEYGEVYRVTCTHYGNVDGYRELYHESEGATCVY